MSVRNILTLAGVVLFAACGDVFLSHGMKNVVQASGHITVSSLGHLVLALLNPWILAGICLLIGFFVSYLTALSWADLTYVLPSTAVSYVIMALLARFFLHENISVSRWIGILLITAGVGFVAGGEVSTSHEQKYEMEPEPLAEEVTR